MCRKGQTCDFCVAIYIVHVCSKSDLIVGQSGEDLLQSTLGDPWHIQAVKEALALGVGHGKNATTPTKA